MVPPCPPWFLFSKEGEGSGEPQMLHPIGLMWPQQGSTWQGLGFSGEMNS